MPKICISTILGNQVRRQMLQVLGETEEMSREEYSEKIEIPEFLFKMNLDYLVAGGLVEVVEEFVKITELGKEHIGKGETINP